MNSEVPNDRSTGSGSSPEEARRDRQAAYRARQREVAVLLARLWRLRRMREAGGRPIGLTPDRQWEEFAVLLRQLVHEEELLAGLGRPTAQRAGDQAGGQGLSTAHTVTPSEAPPATIRGVLTPDPVYTSSSHNATHNATEDTHNATGKATSSKKGKKRGGR